MAKSSKKKKSIALRIFNILFIVAAVIAVAVAIMMFTPIASSLKGALKGAGPLAADIAAKLNAWVKFHICDNFGFGTTFRGHGVTFTSCMYIYIMCLGALLGFFLMYVPFLFRHRNKVDGKKDNERSKQKSYQRFNQRSQKRQPVRQQSTGCFVYKVGQIVVEAQTYCSKNKEIEDNWNNDVESALF